MFSRILRHRTYEAPSNDCVTDNYSHTPGNVQAIFEGGKLSRPNSSKLAALWANHAVCLALSVRTLSVRSPCQSIPDVIYLLCAKLPGFFNGFADPDFQAFAGEWKKPL